MSSGHGAGMQPRNWSHQKSPVQILEMYDITVITVQYIYTKVTYGFSLETMPQKRPICFGICFEILFELSPQPSGTVDMKGNASVQSVFGGLDDSAATKESQQNEVGGKGILSDLRLSQWKSIRV